MGDMRYYSLDKSNFPPDSVDKFSELVRIGTAVRAHQIQLVDDLLSIGLWYEPLFTL